MKKSFLVIALLAVSICFLSSCTGRSIDAMERDTEYDAYEAEEKRYHDGIEDAQKWIDSIVEMDIQDLEFDIEDKYGVSPEVAILILENYADGEPISQKDLCNAIWAVSQYFWDSRAVVNGIDDYWID